MSFEFDFRDTDSPEERVRSAVFQALGAASTCWDSLREAGVFDSTRALEIGNALLKELGYEC